jgi:hypothetical protein
LDLAIRLVVERAENGLHLRCEDDGAGIASELHD